MNKHGDDLSNFKPWFDLRQDYFAAIKYLKRIGEDLPDKAQLLSARREQMQKYIDKADDIHVASSLRKPSPESLPPTAASSSPEYYCLCAAQVMVTAKSAETITDAGKRGRLWIFCQEK